MRPIDADACAAVMRKRQDACLKWRSEQNEGSEMYARAEQALVTFIEARLILENQPTIDAIPVEWIENRLDAMLKGTASAESCFAVQIMLVDWQKEKEAR